MIKLGPRPTIGAVTAAAVLAKGPIVTVILIMTAHTGRRGPLVNAITVTVFALRAAMSTSQLEG